MIIGTTGSYKQNSISISELLAVVKAAAKIPTCVQYKGTLENSSGYVFCDLHFYQRSTLGCKTWTEDSGPIAYTARHFKGWQEVSDFLTGMISSHALPDVVD